MDEMVYVIGLSSMEKMRGLAKTSFTQESMDLVGFGVALMEGFFMDRKTAENSPQFKQIIPYMVLKSEDGDYLTYQRQGSEDRLTNKYSIGLGGHINPIDQEGCTFRSQMVWNNMARELTEELRMEGFSASDLLDDITDWSGVLYVKGSDVNTVHLGVVYTVPVSKDQKSKITIRSEGKNMSWKTSEDLRALGDSLEDWSKVLIGTLV